MWSLVQDDIAGDSVGFERVLSVILTSLEHVRLWCACFDHWSSLDRCCLTRIYSVVTVV